MKSLEHIIREIREGKCCCEKKKDSLEHAIRKVTRKESSFADRTTKPIEDDVGGLIGSGTGGEPKLHKEAVGVVGTDKYQGNEFKSIRTATPHIKPPAGEGSHSQAPENVSRQRSIAKEKAGINRVTEATKYADPTKTNIKIAPVAPETTKSTSLTNTTKPLTDVSKTTPTIGKYASEVGKAVTGRAATVLGLALDPDFGGLLPSKGETKSEFERQKEQTTKVKPPIKLPDIDVKASPKIVSPVTEPKPESKIPDTVSKDKPKPQVVVPATVNSDSKKEQNRTTIPIVGLSVPHTIDYTASNLTRPKINIGHAKAHRKHAMKESSERKEIENMPRKGDRKSIEYVGRKDADAKSVRQKTSRLATIKNVIDEAKKMAVKKTSYEDGKTKTYDYGKDILVINPDQKRIDLDVDGNKLPKDYDNK